MASTALLPGKEQHKSEKHLSSSLSSHTSKTWKSIARDRFKHSAAGQHIPSSRHGSLTLKKQGGGGKFTAGKLLDTEETADEELNPHDPNYDEEEIFHGLSATQFQPSSTALSAFRQSLDEYQRFKDHLIDELEHFVKENKDSFHAALRVAQSLKDLDLQDYHYDAVYLLIKWDIENDGKHLDQIVKLVKCLHDHNGCVLTPGQIDLGLRKLYNSLDDLLLQYPHAKSVLHQYVVSFEGQGLTEYTWKDEMEELERQAEQLKDQDTDKRLHLALNKMLESYLKSEDLDGLHTHISKNIPAQFHYELVKCAMIIALEHGNNKHSELINEMLAAFVGEVISYESAQAGILHFLENCEEIAEEYTNVLSFLSCFVARCVADHVFPIQLLSCPDLQQRKLASQIMEQTRHLLKGPGAAAKLQKVWQVSDTELVSPAHKPQRSNSIGATPAINIGSPLSLGARKISGSGHSGLSKSTASGSPELEKRHSGGNPFTGFVIGAKKPGTAAYDIEHLKKDSPTSTNKTTKDPNAEDAAAVHEKERLDSFGYYDPSKAPRRNSSGFVNRTRFM